ncbi:DNA polymerase III subunit gamma/tau [Thiohalobacter sp. IOR34]|uniref:DNA polymerase III subunit gamma/tau n=1 Tax=Thiohalobacter sp. IOR34 TaxID=3057176 RepID=UPI0025B13E18|nr:DNA polymerase III subunit gamma/tau [Thiohalobacter sp. IOR34]WJW76317.1 DNA polymerase III subunit gamma/tau [Thiohalobacter sp. IOR34]
MSYQVLARKWRPRNFHEMVGQEHVLRALVNALDNDRLHHAYLFTGTRGVGKTTIARIFAKSLNCEQGVGSEPCGRCSACTEIDEGRFVDLIEVDAASRTKVDETRELLENVQYAPTRGRFKVYLIDEVHMFSNHSFNALLKTLEEPPPHVKFLLATTDPQKLPVTILSRCLQFNLKRLPPQAIRDHLAEVLGRESIEAEPAALAELARAADGSMRDALSLLDQAIAYGGGSIREAEVRAMLGSIERGQVYELLRALAAADAAALLRTVAALAERAPDYAAVLAELLSLLQRIAVAQLLPEAVDDSEGDREQVLELAALLGREDVQLYYQIGLIGRRDLPLAPDPRGGLEMVLLRMLAFRPAVSGAAPAPQGAVPAPARSGAAAASFAAPAAPSAAPAAAAAGGDWPALIEAMQLRGMVRQLAENCTLAGREGDRVELLLDPAHAHLLGASLERKLAEALGRHLGREIRLEIRSEAPGEETPAQRAAREASERQAAARQAIENDETIHALEETFNARVQTDTIQPID